MLNNFLQSPEWMKFQKASGRKCRLIKKGNLRGLIIKYDLLFGKSYLYCPYGPIASDEDLRSEQMEEFLKEIKQIAWPEGAIFFRCDPQADLGLEKYGFEKAPQNYYFSATALPKEAAILDISASQEEILKKMHSKARYNIRLAEQKGIEVKKSFGTRDLDIFYDLIYKTSRREKIKPHPKKHYQNLLKVFDEKICLFLAFFSAGGGPASGGQGQPIAAIMILFSGDTATYLHGGFDWQYRNLMAPHLLQWKAICEAKKMGCSKYDFGGISLEPNHPWAGITRFKLSFGAEPVIYPGAYDLIFKPIWYKIYNLTRRIRLF